SVWLSSHFSFQPGRETMMKSVLRLAWLLSLAKADIPSALAKDAECHSGECALNALQRKGQATYEHLAALEDEEASNSSFPTYGYHHWSTTTMYGDAPRAACGGIDTGRLVSGTPYHNVASAQSMWLNCGGTGSCWCGKSGGGDGTTGLGCISCAKGRFLRSAYGKRGKALYALQEEAETELEADKADETDVFASEELIVVVGDLCPSAGNEDWCPPRRGQRNAYGSFNHLDFSHYPKSIPHHHARCYKKKKTNEPLET
ncbi:unnamed protein product, partial [Effrenium voratum]